VEAAEGFLHAFSGWLMFAVAMVMVFGVQRAVSRLRPAMRPGTALPQASGV